MNNRYSSRHSLDLIAAVVAGVGILGVLQTFIIGRHFAIPTMILFFSVLFGNVARYGLQGRAWAKQVLFWIFFVLTAHIFFALFWAVRYREILGDSFEIVFGGVFLFLFFLLFRYARGNDILGLRPGSSQ